jgi:hypothetical protein
VENLFPSAALNIGLEQSTVVCIIQSSLYCPHIVDFLRVKIYAELSRTH